LFDESNDLSIIVEALKTKVIQINSGDSMSSFKKRLKYVFGPCKYVMVGF